MSRLDFKAINSAALPHLESILDGFSPKRERSGDHWLVLNPTREDRSLGSFKVGLDGKWFENASGDKGGDLISLMAYCGGVDQATAARELQDRYGPFFPGLGETPKRRELGPHSAEWTYRDAQGLPVMRVRRYESPEGKEFRPMIQKDGRWVMGFPRPRPLFNLDTLSARLDAPVLVVEGEKAAEKAAALFPGFVVTTSAGGSKSARETDWAPLQGRDVALWPDHDAPGMGYAGDVHSILKEQGGTLRVVDVPKTWPDKWDLADRPPLGILPDDLARMISEARPWVGTAEPGSSAAPLRTLDMSQWGIRTPAPMTWFLAGMVPQGQPGILGGRSNAGKSLLAIQFMQAGALGLGLFGLDGPGAPRFSVYVSMEDGEEELERRWGRGLTILAEDFPGWGDTQITQARENVRILVPDWTSPTPKTLQHLVDSIKQAMEEAASRGVPPGLIVVDTLAAVASGEENAAEVQQAFWAACHTLVVSTGATVLILHHSKKPLGVKPPAIADRMSFDSIRGSSAIVAGARFVLQVEPLSLPEGQGLNLDPERVAAGNYPILGLSKQVSGPKGGWILLEQRTADQPGGGFFAPHPESDRLVAHLRSKRAEKQLNRLEAILLDIHRGVQREHLASKHWPDLEPEQAELKLKSALADMRRKNYQWLQKGSMDLTAKGFRRAQVISMSEQIKSGLDGESLSNLEGEGFSDDAA